VNILALDPATRCGWATTSASGTWDLSVRKDESGGMKLIRLHAKLNALLDAMGKIDLVAFEAQRGGNPALMGSLVVQAEIQGAMKLWCEQKKIEYRGWSPSEIKRHATGKGNANKEAMKFAAMARWPDINLQDDNHADALWILDLATKEYAP
jgi:Holliday junction resolvasome RuvABC endonuclease subunit